MQAFYCSYFIIILYSKDAAEAAVVYLADRTNWI